MITSATTTITFEPASLRTRARAWSESWTVTRGESLLLRIGNCESGGSIVALPVPASKCASLGGAPTPAALIASATACVVRTETRATTVGRKRARHISAHPVVVGHLSVPIPGFLDGPFLVVVKIHVGQSEALAVARSPFEVIEQAPAVVRAYRHAVGDRA